MSRLRLLAGALVLAMFTGAPPASAAPPPNDDFVSAAEISALPFRATFDTAEATFQDGEVNVCSPVGPGGPPPPGTVWYRFEATHAVVLSIDVSASVGTGIVAVYGQGGTGFGGLGFVGCSSASPFFVSGPDTVPLRAGEVVYLQGIAFDTSAVEVSVSALPPPPNDDFAAASPITSVPFSADIDMSGATVEPSEPVPTCGDPTIAQSAWYRFTPTHTGAIRAINSSPGPDEFGVFTGSSLGALTQVVCQLGNPLIFTAQAGTTYYLQLSPHATVGGLGHLDIDAPAPTVGIAFVPGDPSSLDTLAFSDVSFDPLGVGASGWTWDFGDGAKATGCCPGHRYRSDGDYKVTLAITTSDGRSASGIQLAHVITHDVAVVALDAPARASTGQTKTVQVTITSERYPEVVGVVLTRRIGRGQFDFVGEQQNVQVVPHRRVKVSFPYTFAAVDAVAGKVTFQAQVGLNVGRDAVARNNVVKADPTIVTPAR